MDEETSKERYFEMKILTQNIEQLREHIGEIEKQIQDGLGTIRTLEEFAEVEDGAEILVPVANGMFTKAKITEKEPLKLNVGQGTVVEKSLEDSRKLIQGQVNELEEYRKKIYDQLQTLMNRTKEIEMELQNVQVSKEQA